MSQTAKAPAPRPEADPVYIMRDSLFEDYRPANAREKMLVTQIAQTWVRLQRALEAEAHLFEESDPLSVIRADGDLFTKVRRYVAECERVWFRATQELKKVQRQRLGPHAFRDLGPARPRTTHPPSPPDTPLTPSIAPSSEVPATPSP